MSVVNVEKPTVTTQFSLDIRESTQGENRTNAVNVEKIFCQVKPNRASENSHRGKTL